MMATSLAKRRYREARGALFAALLRLGRAILARLPIGWTIALGALGGRLAWGTLRTPRRLAIEHLAVAFPEASPPERRRIARNAFENTGRTLVEMVAFPRLRGRLADYVDVRGLDNLDRALAAGRGVVAVAAHLGNWELLAASVAARGYRVAVVGRRPHERALFELLESMRRDYGVETIWRESGGSARQILRALRAGGIVALLIDQESVRVPCVTVPFFGRPARTPSGAATLARRFDAPLVCVFGRRQEGGHVVEFEPPIDPKSAQGSDPERELTARLTQAIEARIRAQPEEWVWWHRRWRQRDEPPAGSPGPAVPDVPDRLQ